MNFKRLAKDLKIKYSIFELEIYKVLFDHWLEENKLILTEDNELELWDKFMKELNL